MAATAQEGLTHCVVWDDTAGTIAGNRGPRNKVGWSKHGVWSLATVVSLSVTLTTMSFYAASSSYQERAGSGATVVIMHTGSVVAKAVMALAAWMVWAKGGLHWCPAATLALFETQLAVAMWLVLALRPLPGPCSSS